MTIDPHTSIMRVEGAEEGRTPEKALKIGFEFYANDDEG